MRRKRQPSFTGRVRDAGRAAASGGVKTARDDAMRGLQDGDVRRATTRVSSTTQGAGTVLRIKAWDDFKKRVKR